MAHTTRSTSLRIGGACLLAVLALLAARAPWATAGPAKGESPATDAAQCERPSPVSQQAAVAEAMERVRQQAAGDDSGWVVLNNRGYNYGPPPGPLVDAEIFLREPAGEAPETR